MITPELLKFSNIRYIPLETSDDCLIGTTSKVLIRDNRIYVADFHKTLALFVFDMNGKFLFKISNRGQGPGEYIRFNDFDIQSNGDIYMFDHFGKKFLVFNSKGKYLKEIKTDYYFSFFCIVKDNLYLSCLTDVGKKFADLAVYDMVGNKTEFLLKDKKFLTGNNLLKYGSYKFFNSNSDVTYYSPKFSPIIYAIDDNGVRPAIGIKGKNLRIPPEDVVTEWESKIRSRGGDPSAMIADNKYFKENTHIYETDKHITFAYIQEYGKVLYLIYDKQSGMFSYVFSVFLFMNLGAEGPMGSTGKAFFSRIDFNLGNEYHKKLLESRKELKNWKEEDNPVIVLFNFDL
ncbi:hypothetical protein FACS1894207_0970 [Bacteroidia bacterium]|nr:hypothetical protein FACS1894207_0970 [Bacteroidia bacterium]